MPGDKLPSPAEYQDYTPAAPRDPRSGSEILREGGQGRLSGDMMALLVLLDQLRRLQDARAYAEAFQRWHGKNANVPPGIVGQPGMKAPYKEPINLQYHIDPYMPKVNPNKIGQPQEIDG